jgi:hypothetical protein
MVLLSTITYRLTRASSLVVASFAADGTCNWASLQFNKLSSSAKLFRSWPSRSLFCRRRFPCHTIIFNCFQTDREEIYVKELCTNSNMNYGCTKFIRTYVNHFSFHFLKTTHAWLQMNKKSCQTPQLHHWRAGFTMLMRSCPPFPVTSNTSSKSSTTDDGSTTLKSLHPVTTQA